MAPASLLGHNLRPDLCGGGGHSHGRVLPQLHDPEQPQPAVRFAAALQPQRAVLRPAGALPFLHHGLMVLSRVALVGVN